MNIENVLKKFREHYLSIFEAIYPSKNSTGFTERNLSVNFAKSYEYFNPDAITWYEFQFGEKNNLHYDCIIVNTVKRELVIIESKRFSNVIKKVTEVEADIKRINGITNKYRSELVDRIPNLDEYSFVGVILADIWTETKSKTALHKSFSESAFLREHCSELFKTQDSWFLNGRHFSLDFEDVRESGVYNNDNIRANYHLIGMIWDINKD